MEGLADKILAQGVAVEDAFLQPMQVRSLWQCAEQRRCDGNFTAARVGADELLRKRDDIRGDSTCWLGTPLFDPERRLLDQIELLRLDLNRAGFLGLFDVECHYALYPPGAGYARHLDQLRGRDNRRVSLVLYLNETWMPGDGGELRVFGADGGHRDVEPFSGRLVCFMTEGLEHAVLPTRVDRLSISGWFRTRHREA